MTDRPSSYSSLTTVQRCERKFAYKYVHRLRAVDREKPNMALGSWWHALRAVDAIRRGTDHGSLIDYASVLTTSDSGPEFATSLDGETFRVHDLASSSELAKADLPMTAESVVDVAHEWWARLAEDDREDFVEDIGAPLPDHLWNLWQRHLDRWHEEIAHERPLLVESEWEREIGDTGVVLRGRIDEVYIDVRKGIGVVRDWKSHGSWPSVSDAVLDLQDAQIHLYAWGASGLLAESEHSVGAVEYDRVRVKVPSTPSWTKSGNMSKSTTDYDLFTYLATIEAGEATYERYKKNIPDEELDALDEDQNWKEIAEVTVTEPDPDVVEELSTEEARNSFFRRGPKPINVGVIRSHLHDSVKSAERGDAVAEDVAANVEIPRSTGRHCQWCDFLSLCRAEMFGDVDPQTDPETFGLRSLPQAD